MEKLKFIFVILAVELSCNLQGQSLKFITGPEQDMREVRDNLELKSIGGAAASKLFGGYQVSVHNLYDTLNKKAYLILAESGDKFYNLTTYDNYISFAGTKKLNAESAATSAQKISIGEVTSLKGKNYIFYVIHDEKGEEKTVYVNQLSKEMVMLGAPVKITSASDVKKKGAYYFIKASPKNKYIGILQVSAGKGSENSKFLTVLDENLSAVWKKTLEGNQFAKGYEPNGWEVDDEGNVYEFGYIDPAKNKKPILYSYFRKTDKIISTPITHNENEVFGSAMKMPEGGTSPVVIGLFEEKKQLGYVVYKPDPSASSVQKLKSDLLTEEFMGPSRKWQFFYDRFEVKNVAALSNGDVVFSLESNYMVMKAGGFPTYHSGPVVVVSLNQKGEENWKKLLMKWQSGAGAMFSIGHMLIPVGDQLIALYNDNPNNLLKTSDDPKLGNYNGIKTSLVMQKFDSKGTVKKNLVKVEPDTEDFVLVTGNHYKISKDFYQVQFIQLKGMKAFMKTSTMAVVIE